MYFGRWLPVFWMAVLPPASYMDTATCFEMWVQNYQTPMRHTKDYSNLEPQHHQNLKTNHTGILLRHSF
jgi:hypothetical protein